MALLLNVLGTIAGIAAIGWFIWWRLQKDQAGPWGFVVKCAATAAIGFVFVRYGMAWVREGDLSAALGLGIGMVCGLATFIIWSDDLIGVIGNLFGNLISSDAPLEPKPYYSAAEAKRMAGNFTGAIADVRAELVKFPQDFDGHMRLAALLAEHSEDLPAGLAVIEDSLRLKQATAAQISYALHTAADWLLKFGRNAAAAREAVERIITLLPGTELALRAEQRLANFTTAEMLEREDNRQPIVMPVFERKLGLRRKKPAVPENKVDINAEERRLQARLGRNGNDWVAREELARLYVEQFEFYDRGLQELERLISAPGQPKGQVVTWLHQKADWQVKYLNDAAAGRATLKRIQVMYPNSAFAHRAAMAMEHLQADSTKGKKKAEELSSAEEEGYER